MTLQFGRHPAAMTIFVVRGDPLTLVATNTSGWTEPVQVKWYVPGLDDPVVVDDATTIDGDRAEWVYTPEQVLDRRADASHARLVHNGVTESSGQVNTTHGWLGKGPTQTIAVLHTGPAGKSAYQVAVDNGFEGTEAEWLASHQGDAGPPNTLTVGAVTTLAPGEEATAEVTGEAPEQTLNLGLPKGATGDTGPPNTLTVGAVTTLEPGEEATAEVTGEAPEQTLNLGLPKGASGDAGRGVVSIDDDDDDGIATVTYTDATTGSLPLPPGPAGNDSTVPGPPNSLSIGTVTTGAAGSSAAASITGDAPEQELNLTIPRGDTGSPTAFELRGTGMPNGVVTANPGTYYTDTAGTNGAWQWLKKTGTGNTGWDVVHGDTGWRDVTSLVDSARWNNVTSTLNYLLLRRIGYDVQILCRVSRVGNFGTSRANSIEGTILTLPSGFHGIRYNTKGNAHIWANNTLYTASTAGPSFLSLGSTPNAAPTSSWSSGDRADASGTYPTTDSWPTTLPGTPA